MSEKKEAVSEPSGLSRMNNSDTSSEYYVPDYVMRDFGELEDGSTSSGRASGMLSSVDFLL